MRAAVPAPSLLPVVAVASPAREEAAQAAVGVGLAEGVVEGVGVALGAAPAEGVALADA